MAEFFDQRRHSDPQGVIDDLVGQTTRQAKAIGELNKKVAELEQQLAEAKGEAPPPKKGKKK